MKRIVALLIVATMLVSSAVVGVSAESTNLLFPDANIEEFYYNYKYVADPVETLVYDTQSIAYWRYSREQQDKTFGNKLLDLANMVIGEKPDKKYYTEVLVNMITLMEYDMSQQVEKQQQFDDMKSLEEYALDVGDLAANFIGLSGASEKIKKAVEAASNTIGLSLKTIDELKYYQTILRNYASADLFLEAVHNNTKNQLLKDAASDLRNSVQKLFTQRMSTVATHGDNTLKFTASTFLKDFSFSLLKKSYDYQNDRSTKEFVDFVEASVNDLAQYITAGKTIFEMCMLFGDTVFGTTNTFRRHNEMMALGDIATALTNASRSVQVSLNDPAETIRTNVEKKCQYFNMLMAVHLRGEYLMYSLNQNDAGILSAVMSLLDCFKDSSESVNGWYRRQVERFQSSHKQVNMVLENLYQQEKVVHEGVALYDGFIVAVKQRTEVPAGYVGIYSFEDFDRIAQSCPSDTVITTITDITNELTTGKYILMNDITFPAEYDAAAVFCGTLDGNGYTMHNVSRPIFCFIGNATVTNLGLEVNYREDLEDEGCTFGAIAQSTQSVYNTEGSTIDNCYAVGTVSVSCRSGTFGGLIGGGAAVLNCYNKVNFDIKTRQGGLAGGISGSGSSVINCFNEGDISMHATCENTFNVEDIEISVGGIEGYARYDTIRNCYNTGDLRGEAEKLCRVNVGGVVAYAYDDVKVENSYNMGQITNVCSEEYDLDEEYGDALESRLAAGGVIGVLAGGSRVSECFNNGVVSGEHFSGGIVGISYNKQMKEITDCYNTGSVTGVQYAGGIAGKGNKGIIKNCYNTGTVNGLKSGAIAATLSKAAESLQNCYFLENGLTATYSGAAYEGATKLSAEDFGKMETFAEFDFLDVWRLHSGDTLPTLKQQHTKHAKEE